MIKMAVVSRSVYMDASPEDVFKYYARPEHIAGTFPDESKMKIVPIKITEGWGVGTVFRIIGEFGGRKMEWDNLTCEHVENKRIVSKSINGPFKKNIVTVTFDKKDEGTTVGFKVDYELPYNIIGKLIDNLKLKSEVEMGVEMSLNSVKKQIDEKNQKIPLQKTE